MRFSLAVSPIWLEDHPQVPPQQPELFFHRQERFKPVQQGDNTGKLSADQWNQQVLDV